MSIFPSPVTLLPFGVFLNINPLTASPSFPYAQAVDRAMTLIQWTVEVYVFTTNTAANYWQIQLSRFLDSAVIAQVDTSLMAPNTHTLLTTQTFSFNPITRNDLTLYMICQKVGAPGNLQIVGPALQVLM